MGQRLRQNLVDPIKVKRLIQHLEYGPQAFWIRNCVFMMHMDRVVGIGGRVSGKARVALCHHLDHAFAGLVGPPAGFGHLSGVP